MNILPANVQKIIDLLQRLPGLGPKSAARIAMYLLKSSESYTTQLGKTLMDLTKDIVYCRICSNIASSDPCDICSSSKRDKSLCPSCSLAYLLAQAREHKRNMITMNDGVNLFNNDIAFHLICIQETAHSSFPGDSPQLAPVHEEHPCTASFHINRSHQKTINLHLFL